jgi:hypothetical protein
MKYSEIKNIKKQMKALLRYCGAMNPGFGVEDAFRILFPGADLEHLNVTRTHAMPLDDNPKFKIFVKAVMKR